MSHRIYTEEFLESCDPDIAALYFLWKHKSAEGRLPGRKDLDPVDLKRFLRHMMLVDVERPGPRFRYRLVGTGEVQYRGMDPTGMYLEDAFSGLDGDYCDGNYRYVAEEGKALFDASPEPTSQGNIATVQALFLPLAADGKAVDMVLVYCKTKLSGGEFLSSSVKRSGWSKSSVTSA